MIPVVVTYNLAASSSTTLVNAQGTVAVGTKFTLATTILDAQRRVLLSFSGNESLNTFNLSGTNQSGAAISETLNGTNATTAQSLLDYKTVTFIQAVGSTAATVSAGTNGIGSSLWNIVNWHVTPFNLQFGTILQAGAATWTIEYTYDDPNNLPSGVTAPQQFKHPTINAATASIDGSTNDPVTAWRLTINAGTGTVRAIGIQAGIAGP